MRRSVYVIIAVALAGLLAFSGIALAAQGGIPGPPSSTTPPDSTTTTAPTVWTCQARVDNGARAWHLGYYADGAYRVPMTGDDAFPACIDLRPEHAGTRSWTIAWGGTIKNDKPMTRLMLRFEAEVHSGTYLERVVTLEDPNPLTVTVSAPPDQAFVFVAMPWTGDKWTSSWIILTPGS